MATTAKKIILVLTPGEARAISKALGCPLQGDDDDAIAVFGSHSGIRAAQSAEGKIVDAMNGRSEIAEDIKDCKKTVRELRSSLERVSNTLIGRAQCDGGLVPSERRTIRDASNAMSRAMNHVY